MALLLKTILACVASTGHAVVSTDLSDGSCECLEWSKVYKKGKKGAICGSNAEFYFATGATSFPWGPANLSAAQDVLGKRYCRNFYEKLNHKKCVNLDTREDKGQWCYVDSSCSQLRYGHKNTSVKGVSLKTCINGEDEMLRNLSPEQLVTMAKNMKLDLGVLHKMSYPRGGNHLWRDVQPAWADVPLTNLWTVPRRLQEKYKWKGPKGMQNYLSYYFQVPFEIKMDPEDMKEMRAIKESGKPHFFDTDKSGQQPHVIVQGNQVWIVFEGLLLSLNEEPPSRRGR